MVDIVETPEKGDLMIRPVPVVEGQVHQQEAQCKADHGRKRNQVEKTKSSVRCPRYQKQRHRLDHDGSDHEGTRGEAEIDREAIPKRLFVSAQWVEGLQQEEEQEEPREDEYDHPL